MTTNKHSHSFWFKTIAIGLVCLFAFNSISWSLPKSTLAAYTNLTEDEFKEMFKAKEFLMAKEGAHEYIRTQVDKEKQAFGKDWKKHRTETVDLDDLKTRGHIEYDVRGLHSAVFVRVSGLLASTGQPAYVELNGEEEEFKGMLTIYIDSTLTNTPNKAIQKHEIDEIFQWENLRINILHIPTRGRMYEWIVRNIDELDRDDEISCKLVEESEYADCKSSRAMAKEIHKKSYSLDSLYDDEFVDSLDFDVTYINTMLSLYGTDEESKHKNIAAQKQKKKKISKLELPNWINKAAQKKQAFFFGKKSTEGHPKYTDLLGSKGTNLATMARMGLPVSPGFTLTVLVTLDYLEKGRLPQNFQTNLKKWVAKIEKETGKKFGDTKKMLLLSVRSGAKFSMPGFLKTVTNIGLNDETVKALAEQSKDRKFAYDTYARFIVDYATEVLGINGKTIESITAKFLAKKGVKNRAALEAEDLEELVQLLKNRITKLSKKKIPDNPYEQLIESIKAVMSSWESTEAKKYRKRNNIPDNIGTAVNVQAMVFGNKGDKSATGVAFSRNPINGENEIFGEISFNGQGKDIVSGKVTPQDISVLKRKMPSVYKELKKYLSDLEEHFSEIQEVEFTIEDGKLYLLQTRGNLEKVTPLAKILLLTEMQKNGHITEDELYAKTTLEELQWLRKALDSYLLSPKSKKAVLATGIPASPGFATGKVVFNRTEAIRRAKKGEKIIWAVNDFIEFTEKDEEAVKLVDGVLMRRGGVASHPAVLCRGLGQMKPVVTGAENIVINPRKGTITVGNVAVKKDSYITLDGVKGKILQGKLGKADLVKGINHWRLPRDVVRKLDELIVKKAIESETKEVVKSTEEKAEKTAKLTKIPEETKRIALEILNSARKIEREHPETWRNGFRELSVGPSTILLGESPVFPDYDEKVLIIRYLYSVDKELVGRILSCAGINHDRLRFTFEFLQKPKDFNLLVSLIEKMAFFDITELNDEEKNMFYQCDRYTLVRLLADMPETLLQRIFARLSKKALHNIAEQTASLYTLSSIQQMFFCDKGNTINRIADNKKMRSAIENTANSLGEKEAKAFMRTLSKTAKAWVEGKVFRTISGEVHIGAPATLLCEMHKDKVFCDNFKKSIELAGKRNGKDSQRTIERELRILQDVGLVEKTGLKYYLTDWLGEVEDIKDFIDSDSILILLNKPSLKPSLNDKEIKRVKRQVVKRQLEMFSTKDIDSAIHVLGNLVPAKLEKGEVYEVRYNKTKFDEYEINARLNPKENSPRALLQAYIDLLRMRAGDSKSIKLIPCYKNDKPLISVSRYASKDSHKPLGEGSVDVSGDIRKQPLRIVGILNMAFAASNIPNDASLAEMHKYTSLLCFIKNQYKDITGKELTADNLLQAIRWITLPSAKPVPIQALKEYYRLTIDQLHKAA